MTSSNPPRKCTEYKGRQGRVRCGEREPEFSIIGLLHSERISRRGNSFVSTVSARIHRLVPDFRPVREGPRA